MDIKIAFNIQKFTNAIQKIQQSTIERLASGLRINSAKDDAAGLGIANRINTVVRSQTVAIRNANDGISYSQTADSALSNLNELLQRMRDLALQSSNATNTLANRAALNSEFTQLQSEITHITNNTTFNNESVFNGNNRIFQIGSGTSIDNQIAVQGGDLISDASYVGLAAFINTGVTLATLNTDTNAFIAAGGTFNTSDGSPASGGVEELNATISAFVSNIPAADQLTFNTAKIAFISAGGSFSSTTGNPVMAKSGTATVTIQGVPQTVPVSTQSDIQTFSTYVAANAAYLAAAKGIQILDQPSAMSAIVTIDNALKEVDSERSLQGAFQNRLLSAISNLQVSIETQSAARSRILDADFASETTNLTRSQIMQQAALAIAAQANQLPNEVLSLLNNAQNIPKGK